MVAILDDKKFQKCQDMQYKKMIQKKKNLSTVNNAGALKGP